MAKAYIGLTMYSALSTFHILAYLNFSNPVEDKNYYYHHGQLLSNSLR